MKNTFKKYDITLSDYQTEQLQKYYELLIEWNEKINLTAITKYEDVIVKHFIDSALLCKSDYMKSLASASVLDVGTGAGFPGMVLAIMYPNFSFTLVDSLQKRVDNR